MEYKKELTVAIKAVIEAVNLCQAVRSQIGLEFIEKEDKSPVTIADFGAQALICRALAQNFPNDSVVGEEDADRLKTTSVDLARVTHFVSLTVADATESEIVQWIDHGNGTVSDRYWTLDPVDGTKGFLRGDQYAIALALVEDGEVKVAVLACPALPLDASQFGSLLVAVRGEGAKRYLLNDKPFSEQLGVELNVCDSSNSDNFRFVESVEHGDKALQKRVAAGISIEQPAIQMDSQAKYAAVAAGQAALYLRLPSPKTPNYREKIWDHAAGVLIVEEAGGRVTDMLGKPLDFSRSDRLHDNKGVVVSNGSIHDSVLTLLG